LRDLNAARSPAFPIEAAVTSVLEQHPDFNPKDIDIFGCGSVLGGLLDFIQNVHKPFRFRAQLIGKTAFFVRRESSSPTTVIRDIFGYWHSFCTVNTSWSAEVEDHGGHQRIIRYRCGGLNFLVRFGAEGYLPDKIGNDSSAAPGTLLVTQSRKLTGGTEQDSHQGEGLLIQHGGKVVPSTAIIDIKTRSVWKKSDNVFDRELPRLWVKQIPQVMLAYHERGWFDPQDIAEKDMRNEALAWESDHMKDVGRYAALVREIIEAASSTEEKKIEVLTTEDGHVEIRQVVESDWSALPESLRARWVAEPVD
jgi:hypothetical protein